MGKMNNMLIEITNWLNSGRNYEDGVFLYSRYGRNEQLKKVFPNRKARYADKLAYELGKLVGVGFEPVADGMPESLPVAIPEVKEEEKTQMLHSADIQYPQVVQQVIAEMSRLYNERGMLKTQLNAVPDENTDENMAKRRELGGLIDTLSLRMDVLFAAKKAWMEEGVMPDQNMLFGQPADEKVSESVEELLRKRNNLRSVITRAKCMLEYQSQKKGAKPDPMPPCPKRDELEGRIRESQRLLEETEEKLKHAGAGGQDPE